MTSGDKGPVTSGQYFDSEWCQILRTQMRIRGRTTKQLAATSKVPERTLSRVLVGERVPNASELIALCRALDLPVLRMLATIDVVPGITNLLDYVTQLEEIVARVELSSKLVEVDQIHGSTVIANKAVSTGRYRATIEPLWQGTGWRRRHYADLVAFDPVGAHDDFRNELRALLRNELGWFTAGSVGFPPTARGLPTPDLRGVVNVPRFLAIRRGSGVGVTAAAPNGQEIAAGLDVRIPHSICVLGSHWSGSADVACFLGYAFDYDYTHVGFTASRAYSRLTDEWRHELFNQDRLEVARTFFYGAQLGRKRVWAIGGDGDIASTVRMIGDPRNVAPALVYLRVSDRLAGWAARTRTRFGHTLDSYDKDFELIQGERRILDQLVQRIPNRAVTVHVDLPESFDSDDPDNDGRDAFFDRWADLSLESLRQLHRQLDLPIDLGQAEDRLRAGGLAASPDTT